MSLTNDGIRAQEKLQAALKHLVEHDRCYYHRLYDTRAARTYLPKQPADFIAVLRGSPLLIECKSSKRHGSLARWVRSACESHQIAGSRIWTRAGGLSLFLHWHYGCPDLELWPGVAVVDAYLGRCKLSERVPWYCNAAPAGLAQGLINLIENNNYEQSTTFG